MHRLDEAVDGDESGGMDDAEDESDGDGTDELRASVGRIGVGGADSGGLARAALDLSAVPAGEQRDSVVDPRTLKLLVTARIRRRRDCDAHARH